MSDVNAKADVNAMDYSKLTLIEKISIFRLWLMDNDINYQEHNMGHFHIFNPAGELVTQVWPSTEKMIWNNQPDKKTIGMLNIYKAILDFGAPIVSSSSLRTQLESYVGKMAGARLFIVVTELPNGSLETQINSTGLCEKLDYILQTYNQQMCMNCNKENNIVDFIIL